MLNKILFIAGTAIAVIMIAIAAVMLSGKPIVNTTKSASPLSGTEVVSTEPSVSGSNKKTTSAVASTKTEKTSTNKIEVGFFDNKSYYGMSPKELRDIKGTPKKETDVLGACLEYNEKLYGAKCTATYQFSADKLTDVVIHFKTKDTKAGEKIFNRLKKVCAKKKIREYEKDTKLKADKNLINWAGFDFQGGFAEIELRKTDVSIQVTSDSVSTEVEN